MPADTCCRFREYSRSRSPLLRRDLIREHQALAQSIARRFTWPGLTHDDLVQIASIGLIHAVDRYDPDRGVAFTTFATHTIVGEVKRYLRDCGWPVKVPRHLRELHHQMRRAADGLTRRLGKAPAVGDLCVEMGLNEERIVELLELDRAATPLSLEASVAGTDTSEATRVMDHLGSEDVNLILLEERLWVRGGLEALDAPQREIVWLRYFEGLSQSEVALRLGLSQMHISRLERRALTRLRQLLSGSP